MQTYTDDQIGKRSRYYHANMDMDYLEEGKSYKNLKTTYVIFICTFDYMGAGEPVYFFQSYDTNSGLCFDDFRYTIVLNTSCDPQKVPERLRPLFAYINDPNRVEDDFIQTIEDRVQKFAVKHHGLKSCASRMRPANDFLQKSGYGFKFSRVEEQTNDTGTSHGKCRRTRT